VEPNIHFRWALCVPRIAKFLGEFLSSSKTAVEVKQLQQINNWLIVVELLLFALASPLSTAFMSTMGCVDDVLDGAAEVDGDVGVWEGCVAVPDGTVDPEGTWTDGEPEGVSAFADCPKIFDMMSPKIPMIHSLLDFDILK
jgi:hypothetical protein